MEQHHFDIVNHATPRLASMDKALGRGKYTDDLELPNMAYAALVRCPYSHAKVLSIDVSEAEKVPGFLGCALPEEAPQAYFNCSGNPPSPLLMADEKVLTTEPLTIGDRAGGVADGVHEDQKQRHRRRQHHAGPPLHLLQPAAPVAQRPCLLLQDRRQHLPPDPELAGLPRDLLFRRRLRAHRIRGVGRLLRRRRDAPHGPCIPHRAPQRGKRPCLSRAPAHPRHALFRPRGGRGRAQRLL